MKRTTIRLQLTVFSIVAVAAVSYALLRFSSVPNLWSLPYTINAAFTEAGGIYPRAEVDLLGTPVGHVSSLHVDPDGTVLVSMTIEHGVRIPSDVTAAVLNRSVIGEQYLQLTPQHDGAAAMSAGTTIPVSRTATPIPIAQLLQDVSTMTRSIPTQTLQADLKNLATAFDGTGPQLQHILDDSNAITDSAIGNFKDLTQLIRNSASVLQTQVDLGGQLTSASRNLAELTDTLRGLDPTFTQAFANGIRAGNDLTKLLSDNASAIPQLLTNLITITDVIDPRLQNLRKTLVLLPWTVQDGFDTTRYCDADDPRTGQPIASTCHYTRDGKPLWSEHFAIQLPETPGSPPVNPCSAGYDTTHYQPNGAPATGSGARESANQPANTNARCTASPTDPDTPNVRGAQNAQRSASADGALSPQTWSSTALYDPNSGTLAASDGTSYRISGLTGNPPPQGATGFTWLLTQPLTK